MDETEQHLWSSKDEVQVTLSSVDARAIFSKYQNHSKGLLLRSSSQQSPASRGKLSVSLDNFEMLHFSTCLLGFRIWVTQVTRNGDSLSEMYIYMQNTILELYLCFCSMFLFVHWILPFFFVGCKNVNGASTPMARKQTEVEEMYTGQLKGVDVFNDIKSCRHKFWLLFHCHLWDVLHYHQISYCARVIFWKSLCFSAASVFVPCSFIDGWQFCWIFLDLSGCFRDAVDLKSVQAPSLVMWLDPAGMG